MSVQSPGGRAFGQLGSGTGAGSSLCPDKKPRIFSPDKSLRAIGSSEIGGRRGDADLGKYEVNLESVRRISE